MHHYPDHPTWIGAREVLPQIAAWAQTTLGLAAGAHQ